MVFEGVSITDSSDIADGFKNFFASIGSSLDSQLPSQSSNADASELWRNNSTFYLFLVDASECEKIIASLKNTKTDSITVPALLRKCVSKAVSYPLPRIITFSFVTGVFPDSLEIARVTPIFKKGDPLGPSNYTLISSLSYISKIFENCVKMIVCSFFEKYQFFSSSQSSQYGFLKGFKIADARSDLTEYLYQTLNDKEHASSLFIDLRKAFDTVNHDILLCKLECYGDRGVGLEYFRRYLTNRQQFLCVNGSKSSMLHIKIGVPQGSVFRPVLFLIYINDLQNVLDKINFTLFADDTIP